MSLKTQAKVLRALQEQVVEPVGGQSSVRVDVRVIAATNKDLAGGDSAAAGSARTCIFRLNVIPIFVPPLRDARRRRDPAGGALRRGVRARVRPAAEAFSPEARRTCSRPIRWPGNVRELRNVDRAADDHGAGRRRSRAADLAFLELAGAPARPRRPQAIGRCSRRATPGSATTSWRALAAFDGNISRTADALGARAQQSLQEDAGARDRAGAGEEDEDAPTIDDRHELVHDDRSAACSRGSDRRVNAVESADTRRPTPSAPRRERGRRSRFRARPRRSARPRA